MTKRLFDLLLSTAGLIVLAVPLAIIAVCIKLDSRGPLCYRGERVGRHGRRFRIAKFRTMVVDADKIGGSSTADDDPRITRVGAFLRRWKLDELPQLLNVLAGSMSLVGPRPQVPWAVDLYSDEEKRLLNVRPGMTDYASLVFRNEGEILRGSDDPDGDYLRIIAPGKNALGLEYVRSHGPWVDTKLIVATLLAIAGRNAAWWLPERVLQMQREIEARVPTSRRPAAA